MLQAILSLLGGGAGGYQAQKTQNVQFEAQQQQQQFQQQMAVQQFQAENQYRAQALTQNLRRMMMEHEHHKETLRATTERHAESLRHAEALQKQGDTAAAARLERQITADKDRLAKTLGARATEFKQTHGRLVMQGISQHALGSAGLALQRGRNELLERQLGVSENRLILDAYYRFGQLDIARETADAENLLRSIEAIDASKTLGEKWDPVSVELRKRAMTGKARLLEAQVGHETSYSRYLDMQTKLLPQETAAKIFKSISGEASFSPAEVFDTDLKELNAKRDIVDKVLGRYIADPMKIAMAIDTFHRLSASTTKVTKETIAETLVARGFHPTEASDLAENLDKHIGTPAALIDVLADCDRISENLARLGSTAELGEIHPSIPTKRESERIAGEIRGNNLPMVAVPGGLFPGREYLGVWKNSYGDWFLRTGDPKTSKFFQIKVPTSIGLEALDAVKSGDESGFTQLLQQGAPLGTYGRGR